MVYMIFLTTSTENDEILGELFSLQDDPMVHRYLLWCSFFQDPDRFLSR